MNRWDVHGAHGLMIVGLVAAFVVGAGPVRPALAAPRAYTFVKVIDNAQGFNPFEFGCAAVNDLGHVAVRAQRTSGRQLIGLWKDGTFTRIADDRGPLAFLGRNPSVNDVDQVSFIANTDTGEEVVVRGDGGPPVVVAQTQGQQFLFFGFDTSLNNAGRVAFSAELDDSDEGLFSGDGGAITTYYLASGSQFLGATARPSINDAGDVAFTERLDNGDDGVFIARGGAFVTVADSSGPFNFAENPAMNGGGVVAFQATLDDGRQMIVTGDGQTVTRIADQSGPFGFFGGFGPSINDGDVVAFHALLDDAREGVFTGPNPATDRVIASGDPLDGSTVTNATICSEGLNGLGQVAFNAGLADGRQGIFLATPA